MDSEKQTTNESINEIYKNSKTNKENKRLPFFGEFYCLLNEAIRIWNILYVLRKLALIFRLSSQLTVVFNHCFL